jgi:hypothetical protein
VCQLVEGVRALWGFEETKLESPFLSGSGRTLEYRPGPNYQDWNYTVGSMQVSSIHLPGVNNHGALCKIGGRRIGFTGDATALSEALIDFCKGCDICVFDFGHLMDVIDSEGTLQADLEKIVELLAAANPPQARAAHVYLRHLQDRAVSQSDREAEILRLLGEARESAQRRGFTGRLSLAYDGEVL